MNLDEVQFSMAKIVVKFSMWGTLQKQYNNGLFSFMKIGKSIIREIGGEFPAVFSHYGDGLIEFLEMLAPSNTLCYKL